MELISPCELIKHRPERRQSTSLKLKVTINIREQKKCKKREGAKERASLPESGGSAATCFFRLCPFKVGGSKHWWTVHPGLGFHRRGPAFTTFGGKQDQGV